MVESLKPAPNRSVGASTLEKVKPNALGEVEASKPEKLVPKGKQQEGGGEGSVFDTQSGTATAADVAVRSNTHVGKPAVAGPELTLGDKEVLRRALSQALFVKGAPPWQDGDLDHIAEMTSQKAGKPGAILSGSSAQQLAAAHGLFSAGKYAEALELLDKVSPTSVKKNKDLYWLRQNLEALCLQYTRPTSSGDQKDWKARAVECYQKAIHASEGGNPSQGTLSEFNLATLFQETPGDAKKAIPLLKAVVKKDPGDVEPAFLPDAARLMLASAMMQGPQGNVVGMDMNPHILAPLLDIKNPADVVWLVGDRSIHPAVAQELLDLLTRSDASKTLQSELKAALNHALENMPPEVITAVFKDPDVRTATKEKLLKSLKEIHGMDQNPAVATLLNSIRL